MPIIQKGEKIRVTHIQYIQLKTDSIYLLKMDREGFTNLNNIDRVYFLPKQEIGNCQVTIYFSVEEAD